MYNYYKFTNFLEDCDSINYFESLSTQILINYLDSSFIFILFLKTYLMVKIMTSFIILANL